MLKNAKRGAEVAKRKDSYLAINVLHRLNGEIKNNTYLFDKKGEVAFVYNKLHLPPSEIKLGVIARSDNGKAQCTFILDNIR